LVTLLVLILGGLLVLATVGLLGYRWGGQREPAQRGAAAPPVSAAGRFSAGGSTTTTVPPPRLVGTLITRNLGSDQVPDRVFNAVGQGGTTEPRFVVRAGERVRLRLLNRDKVVHSFTLDAARANVDIFARSSETTTFRAPLKPGTYSFYCRYRKVGMNGTLVVRRP
jgi:plastocyanin